MRFSITSINNTTMGEESLDRAVEQAIMGMKKGSHLLKCGRRGKPKFCPFRLSTDEKHLIWYSGEKEKQLRLSSVSNIIPGQRTVNFQRQLQLDRESQSFSLVYSNGERSLDLICKDKAQANSWFVGLKTVISKCHQYKLCNGSRSRRGAHSCVNSPAGVIRRKHNLGLPEDATGFSQARSVCGSPTLSVSEKSFSDGLSYCSESFYASEPGLSQIQNVMDMLIPNSQCMRPNDLKRRGSSLGRSEFQNYMPDQFVAPTYGSPVVEKNDDALKDILIWGEGIAGGVLGGGFGNFSIHGAKQADALLPKVLESAVMLDVQSVCLGGKHAGIVTKNGEVFCWGEEKGGRLGHKVNLDSSEPKIVDSLNGVEVKSIACGEYQTCALTQSGELYTWGDNGCATHADDGRNQWWPRKLSGTLDGISIGNVACGEWHTSIVSTSGRLFTSGDGTFGVLGHGNVQSVTCPKEVDSLKGLVVKSVACGPWHTAAIVEIIVDRCKYTNPAGKLFTWGDGDKGRLGHGNTDNKLLPTCIAQLVDHDFVQVSCGRMVTFGLTDVGVVYAMGSAAHGLLGNPQAKDKSVTVVEGKLREESVKQISSESYHVAVLTTKGSVYTWGKGLNGQLGLGDTEDRSSPTFVEALRDRRVESIACGSNTTAAISLHKPISVHDQSACKGCKMPFGFTRKKHNCYNCGFLFCRACSSKKTCNASLAPNKSKPSRVCDSCFNHLQRPRRVESHSPRQDLAMQKSTRDEESLLLHAEAISSPSPVIRMAQWGQVQHSWLLDMDFSRKNMTIVPFHKNHSSSVCSQSSPRVLSDHSMTMNAEDDIPEPDKMLLDEIRRLRAEVRVLEKQYQIGNTKLQECQERTEEAWAVARDEAAKCKAAKEIIKALALQFHAMSEKRVPKDGLDANVMQHIAPIRTESYTPKLPKDKPAESLCGSPMIFSKTPSTVYGRDSSNDNARSTDDHHSPLKGTKSKSLRPHEWVEEYEPGIYLTLTSLPTGQTSVKRVRFSRKRFSDDEATRWWKENQAVVYRKYGVDMSNDSNQNHRN